ncbi:BED-type domain-containing protein [Citrus sinensis]|uniref:BED-type domain-containing protein n=1 Tax=Citrus sinensis TaxID=2711 RepID=A0ACB8M4C1_CITSI|nr:BED-type domain-containing protein [Citrus sinensis]
MMAKTNLKSQETAVRGGAGNDWRWLQQSNQWKFERDAFWGVWAPHKRTRAGLVKTQSGQYVARAAPRVLLSDDGANLSEDAESPRGIAAPRVLLGDGGANLSEDAESQRGVCDTLSESHIGKMLGHSRSNSMSDDEEQSVQMEGTQRGKEKAKRFVDNKGFRHLCSVAILQFIMPSRRTIGRDVMKLFLEEKTMLKSLICNNKQRVSLTTDLWTSIQNMSYMVITTHFIDNDWCLNRRIISFSAIEDHRGKAIGKKNVACLQDWQIERLFAITVDNATTNDIVVGYVIMQLLGWRNDDALVLAGQYMHCDAIRNAVKYMRSSTMRLRTFKQCAEQVNCPKGIVVLDCPTSAFSASSTPSIYSESGLSGNNGGTSYSQRFTTEANLVDVGGGEGDDTFRVAHPFLGYARKVSILNESRIVVSEVERYLKDSVENPSNLKLNVLLWWKVNGSSYPILEKIARDVLAVPVSTVASESTFSTGRRIIDEYRSFLTPAMVEALICTENWLQSKHFANPVYNIQEDIKEQMFHMELQEELIRSQASIVEVVSADIGVMDV